MLSTMVCLVYLLFTSRVFFSLILIRSAEASAASARQTCPICRSEINVDGDFVLAEAPETDALKKAIKESILEIPKDGKKYE